MLGWTPRLRSNDLGVDRSRDAPCDRVLHGEKIAGVSIETLCPKMGVGLGIDQLSVDADLAA
jgi:hypothetical protein